MTVLHICFIAILLNYNLILMFMFTWLLKCHEAKLPIYPKENNTVGHYSLKKYTFDITRKKCH